MTGTPGSTGNFKEAQESMGNIWVIRFRWVQLGIRETQAMLEISGTDEFDRSSRFDRISGPTGLSLNCATGNYRFTGEPGSSGVKQEIRSEAGPVGSNRNQENLRVPPGPPGIKVQLDPRERSSALRALLGLTGSVGPNRINRYPTRRNRFHRLIKATQGL